MNIRHTHISSIFTFAHWSSGGNGTRNDGRNYIWFRTSRRRERLRLACCRRLKAIHSLLCHYCVSKIPSKWIRNDCVSVELCHNWNANLIQNISNAAKQKKNTKLYADIPKLDGPDTNIPCIKSHKWMPSRASVCVCFFHWFDTCVACNRYRSVKWKIPFVNGCHSHCRNAHNSTHPKL